MRIILVATLAFIPAVFGQHNPTGSYGNVLHPGVPSPGALRAPAAAPSNGGGRIAGEGVGSGGRMGGARFGDGRSGDGRTTGGRRSYGGGAVYVPYLVYGGYVMGYGLDGFYASDYPSSGNNAGPAYSQPYPPESAAPPTVIINQNFQTDAVHPQFRDYSNVPLPQPPAPPAPPATPPVGALADDQPTVFLIAMQDHSIRPVIAYWVQADTLHYVTLEGVLDQVSLAQVDREFSKQLNAERNVPFALPGAR